MCQMQIVTGQFLERERERGGREREGERGRNRGEREREGRERGER